MNRQRTHRLSPRRWNRRRCQRVVSLGIAGTTWPSLAGEEPLAAMARGGDGVRYRFAPWLHAKASYE
jgi:hypothetical protein